MTDNILKYRLFPRYDISKLSFSLKIQNEEIFNQSPTLSLQDVSLSGLRLKANPPIDIKDEQITLIITSENFKFTISSKFIWSGKYFDESTHYGMKFFFDDINTLEGWIGFIKALHYLSLKSTFIVPASVNRLT